MATQIQIVKGSFVNRENSSDPIEENYVDQVNGILDDGGFINPESDLYQNAVAQYNEAIKKGQMVRLSVPKGFCGYTDPTTDEFRVIPDPDSSILIPGQVTKQLGDYDGGGFIDAPITYPVDPCLNLGRPGSPDYEKCKENEYDPYSVDHDIEWIGADFDLFADNFFSESESGIYGSGGADGRGYTAYHRFTTNVGRILIYVADSSGYYQYFEDDPGTRFYYNESTRRYEGFPAGVTTTGFA